MALTTILLVTVDEVIPIPNPVDGTIVRFYSQDGQTFITEGITDENGELTLDIEDFTTYWVRFFKTEYAFDSRLLIEVDSLTPPNIWQVEGRNLVCHPPSVVPELCRASGTVVGAHGAPVDGATFSFLATDLPVAVAGRAVVASEVTVRSEEWGYIEVELIRDGAYDCTAEAHEDESIRVKVPDLPACSITDLVWPYVASVYFEPPTQISMNVGDTAQVDPKVLLSSGVVTPYELDGNDLIRAGYWVIFKVDPPGVVAIGRMDQNTDRMTLEAVAVGTTRIYAELRTDVEARRLPEPVRDFQELTVIVT